MSQQSTFRKETGACVSTTSDGSLVATTSTRPGQSELLRVWSIFLEGARSTRTIGGTQMPLRLEIDELGRQIGAKTLSFSED